MAKNWVKCRDLDWVLGSGIFGGIFGEGEYT
jgi:hypothetical protein